ncbi:hypothetical protein Y013_16250 [Rhodococcus pyridinivorans SB3094]|uniref:Uncharacterized protein n=1 Tax=Rhodococcus pyridinivorans SB3094 TaxID=1435356 RepID=V9XP57_9NOCA|nr:hypothetical protein Y013_16250 [Rhodococcus pyridinivorans SB3094]
MVDSVQPGDANHVRHIHTRAGNGPVDFKGEYIRVENAQLQRIPRSGAAALLRRVLSRRRHRRIAVLRHLSHVG